MNCQDTGGDKNIFLLLIWFLNFKSCVLYNVFVDFDKLSIFDVICMVFFTCEMFSIFDATTCPNTVSSCEIYGPMRLFWSMLNRFSSCSSLIHLFLFAKSSLACTSLMKLEFSYKIMMLFQIICHSYLSGVPNVVPT